MKKKIIEVLIAVYLLAVATGYFMVGFNNLGWGLLLQSVCFMLAYVLIYNMELDLRKRISLFILMVFSFVVSATFTYERYMAFSEVEVTESSALKEAVKVNKPTDIISEVYLYKWTFKGLKSDVLDIEDALLGLQTRSRKSFRRPFLYTSSTENFFKSLAKVPEFKAGQVISIDEYNANYKDSFEAVELYFYKYLNNSLTDIDNFKSKNKVLYSKQYDGESVDDLTLSVGAEAALKKRVEIVIARIKDVQNNSLGVHVKTTSNELKEPEESKSEKSAVKASPVGTAEYAQEIINIFYWSISLLLLGLLTLVMLLWKILDSRMVHHPKDSHSYIINSNSPDIFAKVINPKSSASEAKAEDPSADTK